jgi:hypothetical protein
LILRLEHAIRMSNDSGDCKEGTSNLTARTSLGKHLIVRWRRHKQVLLESYDQRSEQTARIFMEYWRRLHCYVEQARDAQRGKNGGPEFTGDRNSQSNADAHYSSSTKLTDEDQMVLETPQERSIRQACEVLSASLIDKIKSSFPAYDGVNSQADGQLEVAKLSSLMDGDGIPEEVKDRALNLLKNPPQLLRALAAYTKRVVTMINSETDKIDIRADAERLRCAFPSTSSSSLNFLGSIGVMLPCVVYCYRIKYSSTLLNCNRVI